MDRVEFRASGQGRDGLLHGGAAGVGRCWAGLVCALRILSLLGMALLFSDEIVPSQDVVLSSSFPALPTLKAGSNHRVAVAGGGPAGSLSDQKAAVAVHSSSPALC